MRDDAASLASPVMVHFAVFLCWEAFRLASLLRDRMPVSCKITFGISIQFRDSMLFVRVFTGIDLVGLSRRCAQIATL